MIDLALLQSVSYIVGALGVGVAAFYYVMTLRVQQANMKETNLNRRATFANNILQFFLSEEAHLRYIEVLSLQWTDFDDFVKKYDSSVNPQSYAKRASLWAICNSIGLQVRSGVIALEAIDSNTQGVIVSLWKRFKPIIVKYREWEWPNEFYSDWEYLSDALEKRWSDLDSDFVKKMDVVLSTHQSNL
jgi:hypothetical protein